MYAVFNWDVIMRQVEKNKPAFGEIPRFPFVQRDLAIIVDRQLPYEKVEQTVYKTGLEKLLDVKLFDIFESDKIGAGKKSLAISFTFSDKEKTLTDKEIDEWMNTIMTSLEKNLSAEIRK
jgi:phenylalanyl-tRNA synthetase beta chain